MSPLIFEVKDDQRDVDEDVLAGIKHLGEGACTLGRGL
jgi:hypothetical protein